jgi:hypothetical protein
VLPHAVRLPLGRADARRAAVYPASTLRRRWGLASRSPAGLG